MALITQGEGINSWFTMEDANIIIVDVPPASYGATEATEFDADDTAFLLEAQRQISECFAFAGRRTDPRQKLAFPRVGFTIQGEAPGRDWFSTTYPNLDASHAAYAYFLAFEAPGLARTYTLADDEIPEDVKEAAVILAALLKNGGSLFSDNKGDVKADIIGPLVAEHVNATGQAGAVFQRMARWGVWIGGAVSAAGGSRA